MSNQHFTDRDYQLFGVWPGEYPEGGRGPVFSRGFRIFLILAALALVSGGLWGGVKVYERTHAKSTVVAWGR